MIPQTPQLRAYFRQTIAANGTLVLVAAVALQVVHMDQFILRSEATGTGVLRLKDSGGTLIWSTDCSTILNVVIDFHSWGPAGGLGVSLESLNVISPTLNITLLYSQY